MSREVPPLGVDERLIQATIVPEVETAEGLLQIALAQVEGTSEEDSERQTDLLDQAVQLPAKAKVALIRRLISQLEPAHIQAIVEFGLREIGDRHRQVTPASPPVDHNTRLLLKKDYSYQARGLDQPTQYFVYLRRRKPKLDRYIGTLFHVPQGCTLSYFLDAEERLIFNPPHNVFQLRDSNNPDVTQVVRLICLEPPPPDYTFAKQQNDMPEIQLHLEYLDPQTGQPITKQTYPFPTCMYEGGKLDRYRWEVTTITLSPELAISREHSPQTSVVEPLPPTVSASLPSDLDTPPLDRSAPVPLRRVLELPTPKALTFYLSDRRDVEALLKRMRLWVAWSEKAMPQSKWEVIQDVEGYLLMNARFKRRILRFSPDRASVALEHSLPVLMKWFHDLSLAVSQAQSQRQHSAVQLKLAHSLFIDMSLPQTDPLIVLKKLFGADFSTTSPE
ncbi:hypothetical protein [Phormidesmis sp. 146-33]